MAVSILNAAKSIYTFLFLPWFVVIHIKTFTEVLLSHRKVHPFMREAKQFSDCSVVSRFISSDVLG